MQAHSFLFYGCYNSYAGKFSKVGAILLDAVIAQIFSSNTDIEVSVFFPFVRLPVLYPLRKIEALFATSTSSIKEYFTFWRRAAVSKLSLPHNSSVTLAAPQFNIVVGTIPSQFERTSTSISVCVSTYLICFDNPRTSSPAELVSSVYHN